MRPFIFYLILFCLVFFDSALTVRLFFSCLLPVVLLFFFLMFDLKRWHVNILFSSSEVLNVRIPIFSFLLLLSRVNLKQELLFLFWEKRFEFSAVGGRAWKFTNVKVLSHAFRLCQFVQRWWVKSVRRNGRIEEEDIDWEVVAELEKKTNNMPLIWFDKMDAGGQPIGHHDIVPRLIEGSLRVKAVRLFFKCFLFINRLDKGTKG